MQLSHPAAVVRKRLGPLRPIGRLALLLLLSLSSLLPLAAQTPPPYAGQVAPSRPLRAEDYHSFTYHSPTGQSLPYVLYAPKSATTSSAKRPLIVYLHGAISRTAVSPRPVESAHKSPFAQLADSLGCYLLCPYGMRGATWFDAVGSRMVLDEIDSICRRFPIDKDRIFLSGFSDGASGTLYLAATAPSTFAGFIALNGSMSVAATLGASPLYLDNIGQRPLYTVHTQSDMLYPAAMMAPTIDYLRAHAPQLTHRTPAGNHEMSYFPRLRAEIATFLRTHRRTLPTTLSLETANPLGAQSDWLRILALDTTATPAPWHQPYTLRMTNDKANFGLIPDPKYSGDELRVAGFSKGSLAQQLGVRVGDLITHMGDSIVRGPMTSYAYLASKRAGDATSLTLLREGQTLRLEGHFPPPYTYEVFTRQPRSGKVRARLTPKGLSVETSCLSAFEIDFTALPFRRGQRIELLLNGTPQRVKATGKQVFRLR